MHQLEGWKQMSIIQPVRRWLIAAFALSTLAMLHVAPASAADILYSDNFSGSSGSNLAGTTPDVTVGTNTWQGNTGYKADGSINDITGGIWLPFTATPGFVYTLSATFFTANNSGDWLGAGFSGGSTTATTRFAENSGRGWVIVKNDRDVYQRFIGPGATGNAEAAIVDPAGRTSILNISLNATDSNPANWTFSSTLRVNTTNYTVLTNFPASVTSASQFTAIGLSSQSGIGRYTDFSLTATPEPSTYALGAISVFVFAAFSRMRRKSGNRPVPNESH